jgi:hypothetical protein
MKGIRLKVRRDPAGPIELYDLKADPGETTNVADSHPDIVAEMARSMTESHTESDVFKFIAAPLKPRDL